MEKKLVQNKCSWSKPNLTPKINTWYNNRFSIILADMYSFSKFTCEKDRDQEFNHFPYFNFSGMHNQLVHLILAAQPN